nr:RecName: Full=Glycine and serine-rich protein 1; AltName: Full=Uncharacterized shell protein 1; Short=LUSP-1; Flags: Precursor [Lottia gigantea]
MVIKTSLTVLILGVLIAEVFCAGHSQCNRRENPVNPFSYYETVNGKETLRMCPAAQIFNKTSCHCNAVEVVPGSGMNFRSGQQNFQWSSSGSSGGGMGASGMGANGMVASGIGASGIGTSGMGASNTNAMMNAFLGGSKAGSGNIATSGTSSGKFKVTLPFNPLILKWTKSSNGGWGAETGSSGGMNSQSSGSQSGSWGSSSGSWGGSSGSMGSSGNWLNDLQFMGNMRPQGINFPAPIMNIKVSGTGGSSQGVLRAARPHP